jgi:hypothetical protein
MDFNLLEHVMNQCQKMFEALMRTKGHTDFAQKNSRYINLNLQTRWNYFRTGWEMKEATS